MYYQNYEDYMRGVLGYPRENQDTYRMNYAEEMQNCAIPYQNTQELEACYPEIYKMIHPMICEVCDRGNGPITRDMVESMVAEVYEKIQRNEEMFAKINFDYGICEQEENRTTLAKNNTNRIQTSTDTTRKSTTEVESRQRRPNNPFLRDLIRILILNRLLGGFFPNRPPHQRPPMRPPFPGEPRPPRPQPRTYDDYFRF